LTRRRRARTGKGKAEIREILSAMLWKPGERPEDYEILYISRGTETGLDSVRGSELLEVRSDRMVLPDGTVIPLHRVVEVRVRGESIWERDRSSRRGRERGQGLTGA